MWGELSSEWGELSSECGASCLGASFLWGELSWGELSLGRVVRNPSLVAFVGETSKYSGENHYMYFMEDDTLQPQPLLGISRNIMARSFYYGGDVVAFLLWELFKSIEKRKFCLYIL